jgi:hypothetical protein
MRIGAEVEEATMLKRVALLGAIAALALRAKSSRAGNGAMPPLLGLT